MGADAPDFSVTSLAIAMFLITALPVAIGIVIRRVAPAFADRVEPKLVTAASVLFTVIVLAALAANWDVFLANIGNLGPALAMMIIVMMLAGLGAANLAGLTWKERKTVSIEVGIQNSTLGVTLAPLIVGVSGTIPEIGLPSAVYGILMYIVALPFVAWLRTK
jgi:BASS family bile acid:Na+ symporter